MELSDMQANWAEGFVGHDALLMMERFRFCMHSLGCLQDFADDFIPNFSFRPYSENLTKQAHEGGSEDITVVTKDFCKLSCCHFSYDILSKRYQ